MVGIQLFGDGAEVNPSVVIDASSRGLLRVLLTIRTGFGAAAGAGEDAVAVARGRR